MSISYKYPQVSICINILFGFWGRFMSQRLSFDGDGDHDGLTERRENGNNKRKRRSRALLIGVITKKRGLKRAKKAVLSPFNKFQKLLKRDTRSCSTTTSTPCPSNSSLSSSTTRVGSYCCCLCMSKEPQTVDTSSDDIDPNDPRISYVYVKTLLEQNEFYSKECNTHFVD